MTLLRRYGRVGQGILTVVALYYLWRQWQASSGAELVSAVKALAGVPLALSFVGLLAYHLVAVTLWRDLLLRCGQPVSWLLALRLFAYTQFGKYLPGKVGHFLGRLQLGGAYGLDLRAVGVGAVLEQVLLLGTGLALAPLVIAPVAGAGAAVLLLLVAWLVASRGLPERVRAGLDRVGIAPAPTLLRSRAPAAWVAGYLLGWGLFGIGFHLFVGSLAPTGWEHYPRLLGAFALSWVAGALSLLVPAGLGVREGWLVATMGDVLSPSVLVAAAVGSRLWLAAGEAALCLLAWVLAAVGRLRAPRPPVGGGAARRGTPAPGGPRVTGARPGVSSAAPRR